MDKRSHRRRAPEVARKKDFIAAPLDANKIRSELSSSPYYVVFLDGGEGKQTTVVRVKNFSTTEFSEFLNAREAINTHVLQYMDLFKMVAIVYDNMVRAYQKRVDEVKSQQGINAREDLTEINAYFAAFVANMGMYLDCVPKKISSKRPAILEAHNKATNEEYDGSFAYRLFCVLRNYTLHDSPPISGIKGSSRLVKESGAVEVDYKIYIEKDKLMKNKLVARKLATDFALPTEHYPVIETAEEAMRCLEIIHWKTIKSLLALVENEVSLMKQLYALTSSHEKQPYIAALHYNEATNALDAQLELIPTSVIEIGAMANQY